MTKYGWTKFSETNFNGISILVQTLEDIVVFNPSIINDNPHMPHSSMLQFSHSCQWYCLVLKVFLRISPSTIPFESTIILSLPYVIYYLKVYFIILKRFFYSQIIRIMCLNSTNVVNVSHHRNGLEVKFSHSYLTHWYD